MSLESVLRRDRLIVALGLALVVVAAVTYTVTGVGMNMSALTMTGMALEMPGMMMQPAIWTPAYALLVFLMWWVMMVAMMVPSAAPTVLIYAGIARRRDDPGRPLLAVSAFLAGYLAVWGVFSALATMLQWGLESVGVVTGMMEIASPLIAGLVLVLAGLYQFTPLKQACLRHCQHPLFFIVHNWKPDLDGAFRMGVKHGSYCLGCCWFVMGLLFVGGIMNLVWIAGIAIFVALEKFAPTNRWLMMSTGGALTIAGLALVSRPYWAA